MREGRRKSQRCSTQGPNTGMMKKNRELFSDVDANAILATSVSQQSVDDRIVWAQSTNDLYNVKTRYREWKNHFAGNSRIIQSGGWTGLWRLDIPQKIKIFIWRFCRDNIPVRIRLSNKGVYLPISCPICNVDVEHLLHLFFECPFARNCWNAHNLVYDMHDVQSAPQWVLNKLETAKHEEAVNICIILWGIWFWRIRKCGIIKW